MKVIRISSSWCVSCIIMNKLWKELKEKYNNFEYVEYDYDFDKEAKDYNVGEILPVIVFIKDGVEVKRIIGEKSHKEFFEEVEELL